MFEMNSISQSDASNWFTGIEATFFSLSVHLLEMAFYVALRRRLHLKRVWIQLRTGWGKKKKLDH